MCLTISVQRTPPAGGTYAIGSISTDDEGRINCILCTSLFWHLTPVHREKNITNLPAIHNNIFTDSMHTGADEDHLFSMPRLNFSFQLAVG